jgi:outer membrane protein OmpA-like peptidoglycan-associated protein
VYFRNDYPDPKTTNETTTKNIKDLFDDYKTKRDSYKKNSLKKIIKYNDATYKDYTSTITSLPNASTQTWLTEYIDCREESMDAFFDYAETEFKQLQNFLTELSKALKSGSEIKFKLIGSASAITTDTYNVSLSKRRIDSVLNYIKQFAYDGQTLETYIKNKKLTIEQDAKGEEETIQDAKYKSISCTKEFLTIGQEGVFSINAMACRRVRVSDIVITNPQPQKTEEDKSKNEVQKEIEKAEFVLPAKEEDDEKKDTQNLKITEKRKVQRKRGEPRKDLTKKLLRKLLTECNYFDLVKQSNPMIYDGIKEKIKYFQPAFHSITPEGLNSRLVFLQQCMRPGDTIPTVSEVNGGSTTLVYDDVINSVFGAPPICVLRVGDFWHTKVVFDSLSITYDDSLLDLNPEGIGVQPMIATVKMGFNFIGGHGLAEPVAKLQNALSFNYYANTEMYDERAEATEDVTSKYDAELLKSIKDELGIIDNFNRPATNDGGVTIGAITSNYFDPDTGIITGDINYKDIMKDITVKTKSYANTTVNSLETLYSKQLLGGISILTDERKYSKGYFDYLSGNTSSGATIFGKSEKIQPKVDNLFEKIKQDIEIETIPILRGMATQGFTKDDIRKIKNKLKQMAEALKQLYLSDLETANATIVKDELPLIRLVDQINYVADTTDGYINKMGGVVVYGISGTSKVNVSSVGVTNTINELKQDFFKICSDLNELDTKLSVNIIPTTSKTKYNENFSNDIGLETTGLVGVENRCFMVFGKSILEDPVKFITTVTEPVKNTPTDINWQPFISKNVGWVTELNLATGQFKNEPATTGLYPDYKKSKTKTDEYWKTFKDSYYTNKFTNYIPYNLDKTRQMTYSKILSPADVQQTNLKDIYSTVNSTWDKFNLKNTLN